MMSASCVVKIDLDFSGVNESDFKVKDFIIRPVLLIWIINC